MILVLNPNVEIESNSYQQLMAHLARLPDIQVRVHREVGAEQTLTEVYLIGNTSAIAVDDMISRTVAASWNRRLAFIFISGTSDYFSQLREWSDCNHPLG